MDGEMYVRVMTDEQIEMLRRQISAYGSICEQLINAYKSVTANKHDPSSLITRMGLGTNYCDTSVMSGSYRNTGRQRWTPTIGQLEFLERIYGQENGSPSKQRIKEITSELSQHGPITESNVYNWFQNRRARSKRKQADVSCNVESEVETEVESLYEKRSRLWKMHSYENQAPIGYNSSSQSLEFSSEGHRDDPEPHRIPYLHPTNDKSNSSGSQDEISFYENYAPSNFSMNQPPGGRCGF